MEESALSESMVGMRKVLLFLDEQRRHAAKRRDWDEVATLDLRIETTRKEIQALRGQLIQSQLEE